MLIYIIRHGETNSNKEGRLQGQTNDKLNSYGERLAINTGLKLKGVKFNKVFSSPLDRSIETSKLVLEYSDNKDCDIVIDNRLIEISFGDWEGKFIKGSNKEIFDNRLDQLFISPLVNYSSPNGESIDSVINRTQEFIKELISLKDDNTYLVSTHGVALRCMLNFLYEDKKDFWQGHVPYNCCLNIISVDSDGNVKLIDKDLVLYDKELIIDRYILEE